VLVDQPQAFALALRQALDHRVLLNVTLAHSENK